MGDRIDCSPESMKLDAAAPNSSRRPRTYVIEREWLALLPLRPFLLALARPSTASTADAADLDVPSIAKEVAELVLWDLHSDFPSLSAPEPNESVWYAEAYPSPPEIGRKQTLLEDKKGWDKDLSFKSRRKWKGSSLCLACSKLRSGCSIELTS